MVFARVQASFAGPERRIGSACRTPPGRRCRERGLRSRWPSEGSSRPTSIRASVDLPQPLSPTTPSVSPCSTLQNDMGRTARTPGGAGPRAAFLRGNVLARLSTFRAQASDGLLGIEAPHGAGACPLQGDVSLHLQLSCALSQRGQRHIRAAGCRQRAAGRECCQFAPSAAQFRHTGDQALGVGMGGRVEHGLGRALPRRSGLRTSPPPGHKAAQRRRNHG